MVPIPPDILATAVITAIGIIGVLRVVATTIRQETGIHDLRVRVATLRNERLRAMSAAAALDAASKRKS